MLSPLARDDGRREGDERGHLPRKIRGKTADRPQA